MFGTNAEDKFAAIEFRNGFRKLDVLAFASKDAAAFDKTPMQKIHRRRTDKVRDEHRRGLVVNLLRRPNLFSAPAIHHDHAVCERHRFDLIVRHIETRRTQTPMELLNLQTRLYAQLRVEVRKRLVKEERGRFAHDCAPHGDTLTLAARELARAALKQVAELKHLRRLSDASLDFFLRNAADLEPVSHVVEDRHVRIKRVVLEDHCAVAVFGLELIDDAPADPELARSDFFEASYHAQQRRLAAPRRADDYDEFAVLDIEREPVDDFRIAVTLSEFLELNACHIEETVANSLITSQCRRDP